jgi:hypothetical protein
MTGRFDSGPCADGTCSFVELDTCPVLCCTVCGLCLDGFARVPIDWKPEMEKAPVEVLRIMRALRDGRTEL